MLIRHVLRRPQCVTVPQTRRASSRPTRHAPTKTARPATGDGVHSFFHHFAPSPLPRTEPVKRARKLTSLKQHLVELARERRGRPEASALRTEGASARPKTRRGSGDGSAMALQDAKEQPAATAKAGRSRNVAGQVVDVVSKAKTKAVKQKKSDPSTTAPRKRRRRTETEPPPRLSLRADQSKHHDLDSFLAYATSRNLDSASSVYRGTNYEYAVQRALASYHFKLHRTGQAHDLGIDLLGEWSLPQAMAGGNLPKELKVLIQCKLSPGRPCNVRELEGASVGAPSGWRGAGVMAFLVSAKPATLGVRGALQRSRLPMGFLQITEDGQVQQFIWNNVAQEARLTGMSTTHAYSTAVGNSDKPQAKIALVYQGRPL